PGAGSPVPRTRPAAEDRPDRRRARLAERPGHPPGAPRLGDGRASLRSESPGGAEAIADDRAGARVLAAPRGARCPAGPGAGGAGRWAGDRAGVDVVAG